MHVASSESKPEISPKELRRVCWINGYSISGLARKLGYARGTLYYAVKWPERYPFAIKKILSALPNRNLTPHEIETE